MKRLHWIILIFLLAFTTISHARDFELGGRVATSGRATGEASGNDTVAIAADNLFAGRYIQKIITDPCAGSDAPAAYTIVVTDASGAALFTVPARSTSSTERYDVPSSIGKNEILDSTWTFTFTGMGEANCVDYKIIFN